MNYIELHIGDYDRDTAHLSVLEDGIYMRLLRRYYATEAPLPVEVKEIERLLRVRTRAERKALVSVLEEFFIVETRGRFHKRCEEEISHYRARVQAAQKAGRRSGESRRNSGKNANDRSDSVERIANEVPTDSNEPLESVERNGNETRTPQTPDSRHQYNTSGLSSDEPIKSSRHKFSDDDFKLAGWIAQQIKAVIPNQKLPAKLDAWANEIRLMREQDGLSLSEITRVFNFANKHHFWFKNILSPSKLREQYGRLEAERLGAPLHPGKRPIQTEGELVV